MANVIEKTRKNVEVFFTINDSYAKYLSVTLISILKNARSDEHYNFYILTSGISKENKNKLKSIKTNISYNIEFINVEKELFDVVAKSSQKHITKETNYRFLISSIKPNLDKCIFLDADLIVEHSLWDLMKLDIENYALAAAKDVFFIEKKWLDSNILSKKYSYKNTGVILVNLKKWRQENVEKKLFEVSEKYAKIFKFPDQDALNVALANDIMQLDDSWNVLPWFLSYNIQKFDKPKVVHWAGHIKPWNKLFCPYFLNYWRYVLESNFLFKIVHELFSINTKFIEVLRSIYMD